MVPCESYLLWLPVRVTGYGYLRELLVRVTDESHRYSVIGSIGIQQEAVMR